MAVPPYAGVLTPYTGVAPGCKNKIRYAPYVSPGSQISYIATNKGNIKDNAQYITYLV